MLIEVAEEALGVIALIWIVVAAGFLFRLGWLAADRLTGWEKPGLSIKLPPRSHARVWTEGGSE